MMKKEKLFWFIAGAAAVVGAAVAVGMYLKKKATSLDEIQDDFCFEDCDCCCEECDCDESDCCCEDACCCDDDCCCECDCEKEDCCVEEVCDCGCQDEVKE